jgi:4-diphosphocytidyl-2-C-methyl-D-erythritol kinase
MTARQQFEATEGGLLVRAPAKVNLILLIAGKRPDGFHTIETIMAKIDWYDEILIQEGRGDDLELLCRGTEWAPESEDNLVYRAAQELLAAAGRPRGLRLTLVKNIPAGSGLGSASSDAAATLVGLKEYLGLDLAHAELVEIATRLGSDVTFFLHGPLAYCTGKGEKIAELEVRYDFAALLVIPNISISTKSIYASYTHDAHAYGRLSGLLSGYLRENRVDLAARMCANMLEPASFHLFEALGELRDTIESIGVGPFCLSGSGSAMFCLAEQGDAERLEAMRDQITGKTGCRCIVVRNNRW